MTCDKILCGFALTSSVSVSILVSNITFMFTLTSPNILAPARVDVLNWSQFEDKTSVRMELTDKLHWTEQAGAILLKHSRNNASIVRVCPSADIGVHISMDSIDNFDRYKSYN